MTIKEKFQEHIVTLPDTIQFTKDRKYEEAWIIPRGDVHPTPANIEKYLDEPYDQLIVEYMWNSDDCENVYILTIFNHKENLVFNKYFINTTLEIFYNYKDFDSFLNEYDKEIIGEPYLLLDRPNEIIVGIFNHWLSVGPEELYVTTEAYYADRIKKRLNKRPELLSTKLNFQSLLFRVNFPAFSTETPYGFKTPISFKKNKFWEIDIEKLLYWMELFINPVKKRIRPNATLIGKVSRRKPNDKQYSRKLRKIPKTIS